MEITHVHLTLKKASPLVPSYASLEQQSPNVVGLMFPLLVFLHDKKVLAPDFSKDVGNEKSVLRANYCKP
jgi:hypothetical protein